MTGPIPDFLEILRVLLRHEVEFIVVGGVSAVLHGVPVTTADLDIVHRRSPDNVARLLLALDELSARSRLDQRGLRPTATHLSSPGHQLLETKAGLLDILGELVGHYGYRELLEHSEEFAVEGHIVRVLSLEKLIETKAKVGRAKDLAAIPLLRHTLEERNRNKK